MILNCNANATGRRRLQLFTSHCSKCALVATRNSLDCIMYNILYAESPSGLYIHIHIIYILHCNA